MVSDRYDPSAIEQQWQSRWEAEQVHRAVDFDTTKPKWYALTMFPYPSGDIHTGHWYSVVPSDAAARYRRMRGYNVMFPMGFDSFGLPAENAAIKRGIDPKEWTYSNIDRMRDQLRRMGTSFDWSRQLATSDPEFYRWTQWWFLQLFNRGLAYRAAAAANWCPGCQTVLANEQVVDGRCERSDDIVERRFLTQWFFKITDYAEELLRFDGIDWPERIKTMQTNWIGRSEGALLHFPVELPGGTETLTVFTTRPDTVYGATFMVLAPEHPLVEQLTTAEQRATVDDYIENTARTTEIERLSTEREKTGVFTGGYATNPFTGEKIPVWIADYVLVTYGTGAIMAVPAHDERDFAFAKKYGLDIRPVYTAKDVDPEGELAAAYTQGDVYIHSGELDGKPVEGGVQAAIAIAENSGLGEGTVNYRLRDWLISRQRYWGAPIPIIHCPECGIVPVPEDQLPVLLPEHVTFEPTGRSPLNDVQEWVNVSCPQCESPARRETDTLDTFVCSSWYEMRFADPHNTTAPFSKELADYWFPVDLYTGGAEHAVLHLLYVRFFWKAARDMGLVKGDEPMSRLFNQGVILGPDGNRMSKSRGNVVAPDEQVERWGVDALRCQLMFVGPWDQGGPYNPTGMQGISRWLHRMWSLASEEPRLTEDENSRAALRRVTHVAIREVTEDIEALRWNTLIARLMELATALGKLRDEAPVDRQGWNESIEAMLLLAAPLAPHITEELWERAGRPFSIHTQTWPSFVPSYVREDEVEIVVQVNGKVRDHLLVDAQATQAIVTERAMALERVGEFLGGRKPRKVIYVAGKLINIVG